MTTDMLIAMLQNVKSLVGNVEVRIWIDGRGSLLKDDEIKTVNIGEMHTRKKNGKFKRVWIAQLVLHAAETDEEWLERMSEELIEEHDDAN